MPDPEVSAVIGEAVEERSAAWYTMVTRAVARGELPTGTDPRLLLGMLWAIIENWSASSSGRLEPELLETAVRTVVAGARSGSLVHSLERRKTPRARARSAADAPPAGSHPRSRRARPANKRK